MRNGVDENPFNLLAHPPRTLLERDDEDEEEYYVSD
jgi:hypothetical protein